MFSKYFCKPLAPLIFICALLSGCESGGGSDADAALNRVPNASLESFTIQGRAAKGIIINGQINAYSVESQTIDNLAIELSASPVASATTDPDGFFELKLEGLDASSWIYIQITGLSNGSESGTTTMQCDAVNCGTFTSQDTNENVAGQGLGDTIQFNDIFTIENNFELGTLVQVSELNQLPNLSITPLTHMLVAQVRNQYPEISLANIQHVNDAIVSMFALTEGTDIRQLSIINLNDTAEVSGASDNELLATLISSAFLNVLSTEDEPLIDIAAVLQLLSDQGGVLGDGETNGSTQIQLVALLEAAEANAQLSGANENINALLEELKTLARENISSYLLTFEQTEGGTLLLLSMQETNCELGCEFEKGTVVELVALPNAGYQFTSWIGDSCNQLALPENNLPICVLTMDQFHKAQANFVPLTTPAETFTLTQFVNYEGTASSDSIDISGQDSCNSLCSYVFNSGESINIIANPSELTTVSWALDGESVCENQTLCTIAMNQNHIVTTTFSDTDSSENTEELIQLDIIIAGTGEISDPYLDILCSSSCSIELPKGTTVNLKATPLLAGYQFGGWSGLCNANGSCIQTLDDDSVITALFSEIPDKKLDIEINGSGSVTSATADISCTETCDAYIDIGTQVTLTAEPATGFKFTGWSGDCIGTGQCVIEMSNHHLVTANFSNIYQTVTLSWETPTVREDSSTLLIGEIKQYRIYYGEASGSYNATPIDVFAENGSMPVEFDVGNLEIGKTYYFAMKTLDTSNRESQLFSNEVTLTIN